jgi:hypothetical protein
MDPPGSERPDAEPDPAPSSEVAAEGSADADVDARPFSTELEAWLRAEGPKTLGSLGGTFGEKSFAVAILLLMFVPALPLPTGGISHVFEVIAALLGLQMVLGRTTIWLPRRFRERQLGALGTDKAIPLVGRWIRRLERFSRPRGAGLLRRRPVQRLLGLSLVATSITALLSPPFSGLDTIPGVAAVLVCGGILLSDLLLVVIGEAIEIGGVIVIVTVGAAATHWIRQLL